jgi:hypothetical protein
VTIRGRLEYLKKNNNNMENKNQTPLEYFYESIDFLELRPMEWKGIEQNFETAKEIEKQKDAKYNEMLEMLEWILSGQFIDNSEIEQLIKKSK